MGAQSIAMMRVAVNLLETLVSEKHKSGKPVTQDWRESLESHRLWVESDGKEGLPADLSRANLEGVDLTDATLQNANLNQANLRRSDLLLADLRGASLLQADLTDANLLGTKFREADLQGATFTGAKALMVEQLSGANLFGASLPESVSPADAAKQVQGLAIRTGWLLAATLLLTALCCFRVVTISDAQLLNNSSALPFTISRTALPLIPFFLFCPVLILGLYVFLHFHLQRLWEAIAGLPAILPDGVGLDSYLPWFAKWPARKHFRWLRQDRPALAALDAFIAKLFLYGPAPAAMFFFWARYLRQQDMRGTVLHLTLAVATAAAAVHFLSATHRAFGADSLPIADETSAPAAKLFSRPRTALLALAVVLSLLSLGAIWGAPHASISGPGAHAPRTMRTWAADILWLVGFDPSAHLTEAAVSTKPRNWTGRDEDLALVQGANLNEASLRYAQAYRAFFAGAHLWQADLRNARLSESDLREANLRQANLRFAVLDQANLARAILREADLRDAVLTQADLHDANLSYASLAGAVLADSKMDGAALYGAQMQDALLQRASLRKTDLRAADLRGANLSMSDLREAYLSSAKLDGASLRESHLEQAILTETSLQHADLRGANLRGAIMQDANLTGANLQGTQLQGAFGLTASQLCSAANVGQAQLDDNLQHDVSMQCATGRQLGSDRP